MALRTSLEQETERRHEAESHLLSLSDRLMEVEQEIREDCAAEFEQRLALELARWKANMEVEKERGEEHWDRKIDVLERLQITVTQPSDESSGVFEGEDKENVLVESLNEENDRLRRELMVLKRELAGRSPVKRKPLQERDDLTTGSAPETGSPRAASKNGGGENLAKKMERLRVGEDAGSGGRGSTGSTRSTGSSSPKKMRKLNTKQWNVSMEGDDLF